MKYTTADPVSEFNDRASTCFPGLVGIRMIKAEETRFESELIVEPRHHAPNGYLHAGVVVTLADTTCGFATRFHLPEGASGFTTVELKSNHMGTLLEGTLKCVAEPVHVGRSTQVWDATVIDPAKDRKVAVFRCTQMVLWPRS